MIITALDIVESPGTWIALMFLVVLGFNLRRWNRRRKKLNAFIAKHGLRIGRFFQTAPEPGIRGFFFPADYPLWMEGWLDGVPVVAFDYELGSSLGYNRNTRLGSGVGVRRRVVNLASLAPGMELSRNGEWTFLFTEIPFLRRDKRLDPDEMEKLWRELLEAPSLDDPSLMNSRPGEVHVRPRRAAKPWRA